MEYVVWVLEESGWRIWYRGQEWQCQSEAARWPKGLAEVRPS